MSNSKGGLGKFPANYGRHAMRHKNCRDAERCVGPGCVVKNGKTARRKEKAKA